jgi:uncharacterized repeat protein (TIGR02543 family)
MQKLKAKKVRKVRKTIAWLLTVAMAITMFSGMSISTFSNDTSFDSNKIINDFNYLSEYINYARSSEDDGGGGNPKEEQRQLMDDHHVNLISKMLTPRTSGGDMTNLNAYHQLFLASKYLERIINADTRELVRDDLDDLASIAVETYIEVLEEQTLRNNVRNNLGRRKSQIINLFNVDLNQFNEYTVTFKDHDETVLKTETVRHGQNATAPSEPTKENHTFTGWSVGFTNVTGNIETVAQYSINTYTVTFKDHDETVLKTETVEHGANATAPSDPTREGYTFAGWSAGFTNVTGNIEVVAEYEQTQTASTGPIPGTLLNIPVGGGYTFLGEITTAQLFGSGQTILDHFNPTGTNFNTTTNYLKFENTDGTVLFVAKTPVKHTISWDAINGGNATQNAGNVNSGVYGAMQKTINGETYKIRLLTGGNANPASSAGREWNHLLVALNTHNSSVYNDAYFGTGSGNGRASWTQEQSSSSSSDRVLRGLGGVSVFGHNSSGSSSSSLGWRPALELVP